MHLKRALLLGTLCLPVACGGAAAGAGGEAPAAPAASPAASTAAPAAEHDHGAQGDRPSQPVAAPAKNFPSLEYLAQIPYAYRTASQHPELLSQIPCYCPCELYGHGGVIDCYRSQHAAACATCLEEAVLAGQLIEQAGGDRAQYAEVAAQVKNRYRGAIVQSYAQRGEMPNLQSAGGRAYLQACSDCHQPPHPAMYTPDTWQQPLARMAAYTRQRDMEQDPRIWQQAVDYIRATSGQFPPEAGNQYRENLASAVAHLKVAEGESVYYPSPQDPLLEPAWFERMVRAYRLARDIPADVLAAEQVDDPSCKTLLECLNTSAAVTSEVAVEAVERIAAERGIGG